jgi:hypothetical protein
MHDFGCHSLGLRAWVVLVAEGSPCHTPRSARKAVLDELMLTCSEQCLQAVKLLQVRALHREMRLVQSPAPSTPNPALYCPLRLIDAVLCTNLRFPIRHLSHSRRCA